MMPLDASLDATNCLPYNPLPWTTPSHHKQTNMSLLTGVQGKPKPLKEALI
jgi:hypothetical protein